MREGIVVLSVKVLTVQNWWRCVLLKKKYRNLLERLTGVTIVIQRVWRGALARMDERKKNEAAVKISSTFRCYLAFWRFALMMDERRKNKVRLDAGRVISMGSKCRANALLTIFFVPRRPP